jgi:hypothetical protein
VRGMLAGFAGLRTVVLAGRVAVPTGWRADFEAFFVAARTLFAAFLAVRLAVLADRPAAFVECLLIASI